MKKIANVFLLLLGAIAATAQNELYNNVATLQVNAGCIVQVNGDFINKAASPFVNNGTVTVTGNVTNDATLNYNSGTLEFKGTTAQTVSGTNFCRAMNVIINNSAGVILNQSIELDGTCTFTNGLVSGGSPLRFTANGTHSGASDASHVNGFVTKLGTGSFTYPVGDATKYQKVDVNATTNGSGIQVIYKTTDAGSGTFATTGTEATALVSYNKNEYWDILPIAAATTAGTVTIYWDGYRDTYNNALAERKVAHKRTGNWLNEGTTATGSTSAGSVTSNSISTWSPFTLGSISVVLPLQWLNVSGNLNNSKQAVIIYKVNETKVANYQIEKSTDGRTFVTIATINSKGNGENTYQFTDAAALDGTKYYRIKQVDNDGRFSYSTIIRLSNKQIGTLVVYPNPVKDVLTISGATIGSQAFLTDLNGKVIQTINISATAFTLNLSGYASGVYVLKLADGSMQKILKQ